MTAQEPSRGQDEAPRRRRGGLDPNDDELRVFRAVSRVLSLEEHVGAGVTGALAAVVEQYEVLGLFGVAERLMEEVALSARIARMGDVDRILRSFTHELTEGEVELRRAMLLAGEEGPRLFTGERSKPWLRGRHLPGVEELVTGALRTASGLRTMGSGVQALVGGASRSLRSRRGLGARARGAPR